jgi:hypothetical protein
MRLLVLAKKTDQPKANQGGVEIKKEEPGQYSFRAGFECLPNLSRRLPGRS